MTTAHRPTFDTARGGGGRNEGDLSKMSKQYSSRDMPSHMKLKYRQGGQANVEDVREKDFRRELEERERSTSSRDRRDRHRPEPSSSSSSTSSKRPRLDQISSGNLDADDPQDDDDEEDSDDSDEDDTAELMAELSRIKKERAAEKAQQEAARQAEEERIRTENILHGNPLLNQDKGDFKVGRRWDDDVVFKNCAKGLDERRKDPVFINDAIRGEFHKKFMDKYIK